MKNSLTALLRKNITGHLIVIRMFEQTDAVKNTTDTVNPDCCADMMSRTPQTAKPGISEKESAAEVSQEDASSQTTNSES